MHTINSFMRSTNNISNKKTATNTQTGSLKKLMKLGETMIVDKKFDIKQYLDTVENEFWGKNNISRKKNNYSTEYNNFKKINPNYFSKYTNDNFYNNSINTINSINSNSKFRTESFNDSRNINNKNGKNFKSMLKSKINPYFSPFIQNRSKYTKSNFNLSNYNNTNYYLNTFANYNTIKDQNNKNKINSNYNNIIIQNKNLIKSNKEILNDNNNLDFNDEDDDDDEDKILFKVEKVVKEIKKRKNKNVDFYKCLDKINNNYDKKDILIAINSDIILNKFKEKEKKIKEPKTTLNTFITQNKEISINNLLIKVINKESDRLVKKEKELTKDLNNNKNNLNYDVKKFEEYSDKQKVECKKIELTLTEIQKINKQLKAETKNLEDELKVNEYEIYKILTKMNLLRFYALFSNNILDGDSTRFDKNIFPNNIDLDHIDYDSIIKEILDNYSDMISEDKKDKKDDKKKINISKKKSKYIKEEGYFLDDPELMSHKFNELEYNILRLLTSKERLILEVKQIQEKNNESLSYLIDRSKDLQNEYDDLLKILNKEKKKFESQTVNSGQTHININLHDKNNIIKELYMYIINEFEPSIIKFNKYYGNDFNIINRKDLTYFGDIIQYGQNILENIEINLNYLTNQMKEDEKSDEKTFDKVIYGIKKDYRRIRQRNFMKSLEDKRKNLINRAVEKSNKIVIISKKTEAPYFNKKVKVKEKVDLDLVKNEEDKEIITYQ